MAIKSLLKQTRSEKLGTIDGLSLFFGALLGANLGTVGAMPLPDYVLLITLLAGLVMTIRLVHLSERRVYALANHLLCLALVVLIMFVPSIRPEGLDDADRNRLVATILIWAMMTLAVEFYPTKEEPAEP
ncbi:MAG TPA: hypothetical protein VEW71_01150 [Allosphingosinicella sp.]|nr:hypothetical protein [Allosphingosinicella sp.]